jgi:hypothetical protein
MRRALARGVAGILCVAVWCTAHHAANAIDLPTAGTNVVGYNYFGTALPFVDVAHMDGRWRLYVDGQLVERTVDVSADGYPTALAPGEIVRSQIFTHNGSIYPTGQYVLKWQGDGDIQLSGFNVSVVSSLPGQITYQVTEAHPNGLTLDIARTNPQNPLRNISVRAPLPDGGGTFNGKYKSDLARFGVIRYMGWNSVNNSKESTWNNRVTPADFHWGSMAGVPYELQIQLSNELKQDLWLTVPHLADDSYVRSLADLVRQQLSPDLRVWVEYSNEVWNGGYEQWHYAENVLKPRYGVVNSAQAYGRRSAEIFDIFSSKIAEQNRVVRVIGGQTANAWILEQGLIGATVGGTLKADVAAVAPYFTVDTDKLYQQHLSGTVNRDDVFTELRNNIDVVTGWVTQNKAVADAHGIPLVSYEGGQHLVARPGEQHNNESFVNLLIELNRDERMGDLYKYLLDSWYEAGGKSFVFVGETAWPNKWGSWGLKENYLDDNAVKFRAVQEYLKEMHRRVGDFNGDGAIDSLDYVVWLNAPGVEGYDTADYVTWLYSDGDIWTTNGSSLGASAAIPEPSSLIFAVSAVCIGACSLKRRSRRAHRLH